ncbi:TipAS antibiotic-recognition domain-containing protein [Streptomyces sp. NRRL B-24572]|uniref:TipAS antibiotic-recognition domain-containing protein n=1 Tax=Streptomyces sp. NRRL B-24572 TaxID=1962156 RepID=UPI00211B6671|nr:TipAS antibiotic-recognition domain-containing protein [Streptomyces sp. NRRL B-24572]
MSRAGFPGLPLTGFPGLAGLSPTSCAVLALTLAYGAYTAEVYRAGVEGVRKSYGEHEVLKGVDLSVDQHEVVCLIGGTDAPRQALRLGRRARGTRFHPEATPAIVSPWSRDGAVLRRSGLGPAAIAEQLRPRHADAARARRTVAHRWAALVHDAHARRGAAGSADPVREELLVRDTDRHPHEAAEADAQYRALTELRTVSVEEYRALGRSCVDNEQWRAAYEAIAPGLAAYQRDAIEAYAPSGLG